MLEKNSDLSEHFGKNSKNSSEKDTDVTVREIKTDSEEEISEKGNSGCGICGYVWRDRGTDLPGNELYNG